MGLRRGTISLHRLLLRYLIATLVAMALVTTAVLLLFLAGESAHLYTYAGSAEAEAQKATQVISAAPSFDPADVPASCRYLLADSDGMILQTDMTQQQQEEALAFMQGTGSSIGSAGYYLAASRTDGTCILRYTIGAHYTSAWAEDHLPNVEIVTLLIFALMTVAACLAVAAYFARQIRRGLQPVADATQNIQGSDLGFVTERSSIREFDEIALSMEDMRLALSESLEKQWGMEQERRRQATEIAHDLKTPLTIVKGNAELLQKDDALDDMRRHAAGIAAGVDHLEHGISILNDLSRSEEGIRFTPEQIGTAVFIDGILFQASHLAEVRGCHLDLTKGTLPDTFVADGDLLERAIMNMASNAIEHSPSAGMIHIDVTTGNGNLLFSVEDQGHGFSETALEKATERFYRDGDGADTAPHLGLGLTIAEHVAHLHDGILDISNLPENGGGKVILSIPVKG